MQRECTKSALVDIVVHSHILTTIFTRGTRCVGNLYTSSEWFNHMVAHQLSVHLEHGSALDAMRSPTHLVSLVNIVVRR